MNSTQLDALAAAFLTLGRLHLEPPTAETLAQLRELFTEWPLSEPEFLGDRESPLPETADGLSQWAASFDANETPEAIRRDLDLLYGVTATAKVPPFESVHRGDDHLVFDAETLEVRAEYRSAGFEAPMLNREPDDHVGLEFDFVAQLLVRALTARENDVDDADILAKVSDFHANHLEKWAPEMLANAAEAADTHFMTGLELLSLAALKELAAAL